MDGINQIEEIRREIQKRRGLTESSNGLQKISVKLRASLQKDSLDPVRDYLKRAQEKNTLPKWIPGFLHPMRRNQAAVNATLVAALAELYGAAGTLAGNNSNAEQQSFLNAGLGFLDRAGKKSAISPRWLPKFVRPMRRNQGAINLAITEAISNLCALLHVIARRSPQQDQGDSSRSCQPASELVSNSLERARAKNKTPVWLPGFLRFIRRNQGAINVAFINSINELYRTIRVISSEGSFEPRNDFPPLIHQSVHVADHEMLRAEEKNKMPGWLPRFLHSIRRNQGAINYSLITSVRGFEHAIIQIYQLLADVRKHTDLQQGEISNLSVHVNQTTAELKGNVDKIAAEFTTRFDQDTALLKAVVDKIPVEMGFRIDRSIAELKASLDKNTAELGAKVTQNTAALEARVDRTYAELTQPLDKLSSEINALKTQMVRLQEANRIMLGRLEQTDPVPVRHPQLLPKKTTAEEIGKHEIDTFYLAFENRHRGGRDLIKQRIQVYIPFIQNAEKNTKDSTALDIGCGRGEWLELLGENQFDVRGVDLNQCMVDDCTSRGLKAECADGIAYLRSLETASLTAVSGFHIVEHLPMAELMELFKETLRVLRPGGIAIFETPNPEVLKVSTYTFYLDPTHRNPIPHELMTFFGENAGFSQSRIERYQPYSEDGVFKGYGDYAGIFTK